MLLSYDLSGWINTLFESFISIIMQYFQFAKSIVIVNADNVYLTLFDLWVALSVIEILFGVFLFVAPRLSNKAGV